MSPLGAAAAYAELLESGVTTLVDISGDYPGWIDEFAGSGLRGYVAPYIASAEHVMRVGHRVDYEWAEAAGERSFELACQLMDKAQAHRCGRLEGLGSPSTIDTITEELLKASVALAESTHRPFTIHISESVLEFKNMVRRTGVTPIQSSVTRRRRSPAPRYSRASNATCPQHLPAGRNGLRIPACIEPRDHFVGKQLQVLLPVPHDGKSDTIHPGFTQLD